jgi:hypothetical protein
VLYRKRAGEKAVGQREGRDGALSIQPFERSRVTTLWDLNGVFCANPLPHLNPAQGVTQSMEADLSAPIRSQRCQLPKRSLVRWEFIIGNWENAISKRFTVRGELFTVGQRKTPTGAHGTV